MTNCMYTAGGSLVCQKKEHFENNDAFKFQNNEGKKWFIKDNNIIYDATNSLSFSIEKPTDLHGGEESPYIALKDTASGLYVRHAGFVLHLSPYVPNNYDFAWKFEADTQQNGYYIYNDYKDGSWGKTVKAYIGFDGTYIRIVPESQKVIFFPSDPENFFKKYHKTAKYSVTNQNGGNNDGNAYCNQKYKSPCVVGFNKKNDTITSCKARGNGSGVIYACKK